MVGVTFSDAGLRLVEAGREADELWPYAQIALIGDELGRGFVRLARGDQRLEVADPDFAPALHRAMPELKRGRRRILFYGTIATLLFALFVAGVWWGLPLAAARLTALIPYRWEERLGDEALKLPVAGTNCTDAEGEAALQSLTRRLLAKADMPFHVKVAVRSSAMVNAFAFPGGRIVLLDGLLQQAQSADEVAGVLAHELTHTLKRHSMRALIANAGLSLLFELTAGSGTGVSVALLLVTLSNSREMEAEADAGALELLDAARISSAGFASFFERLARRDHPASDKTPRFAQLIPSFLNSHPATEEREKAARAHPMGETTPALSDQEWQALRQICRAQKK